MNLRRQHDAGYAMAALLVAMSIMAIMMTIALPTWRHLAQREKEAELVFRGEQYARALTLFQSKAGPGAPAPSIDILVQQRYLRKKYKDPITNDDFVPIVLSANTPGGTGSTATSTQQAGRGAAQRGSPGQPAGGGTAAQRGSPPAQSAGGGTGAAGGTSPGAAAGGIIGFTSKSKDASILIYKGRTHYNEWQFTPVQRAATPGAGGGQGGAPGGDGRNPRGQPTPGPFGGGQGNPQRGPGRGPFGPGNPPGGPNGPNTPNRGGQPFNPFQPPPTRPAR